MDISACRRLSSYPQFEFDFNAETLAQESVCKAVLLEQLLAGESIENVTLQTHYRAGSACTGVQFYEIPTLALHDTFGRVSFDKRRVYSSEDSLVGKVEQGILVQAPISYQVALQANLSVCSCLLGVSEDSIFFAHVSVSELRGVQLVARFMEGLGVAAHRVYAVASLGHAQSDYQARAEERDYISLGIEPENTLTFNHRDVSRVLVTACNDGISLVAREVCPQSGIESFVLLGVLGVS